MDDDDDFLYGESSRTVSQPATSEPKPVSLEAVQNGNSVVAHLEKEAEAAVSTSSKTATNESGGNGAQEEEDDDDDEDAADYGEETEDSDIEIIMEPVARSLDFRNQNRPTQPRSANPSTPQAPKAPQPSLTTEYTPIQRGGPPQNTATPTQATQATSAAAHSSSSAPPAQPQAAPASKDQQQASVPPDDGIDTSTLPPAQAPPSHPQIDPSATGIFDGRSILELDLNAMADKPWRRPGSDISDWFNYGFDELSWEAYCYRRRDLGEMANVLKTNVINFAAMPEDQLIALPPEVRTMVMTGANAMMNNAAANPGMMGPGVMMDMNMIGPMGMDMGMPQMMPGMMGDGGQGQQGVMPGAGAAEQGSGVGMMQDGFNAGVGGGMMNMGMGDGYVMQDQSAMIYPNVMEQQQQQQQQPQQQQSQQPQQQPQQQPPQNVPVAPSGRGVTPVQPFRGRAVPVRGVRGFGGRGRGRSGMYDPPPPVPVRPASPLPPGVPTGPRNQNKYKDRDGNAPAVDGLDYGGGKDGMARRTPSYEPEERSRKRRSSPGIDDIRSSKRR